MSRKVNKELKMNNFGNQESLQAVVFTDDFANNLKPADSVYPSALIPIINCPLLDYLLETLARSRVQQVFLFCSSHVEKVKAYVQSFNRDMNDVIITLIVSDGCRSLGDAMRDLDNRGIIRGDFILIRGSTLTNVNLKVYMERHKARKEKDKNAAMTMIFRDFGNFNCSVLKADYSYVVSTANSRRLLFYKKNVPGEKTVEMELDWFLEHDKVRINAALRDSRIYICSQSVLPLFADNFDFQTMEDLIRGVLINEEFLDSRIYWEQMASTDYALTIDSWRAYKLLCRDILRSHPYPLAPDSLPKQLKHFVYISKSMYKHETSMISKGCTLHSEVIISELSTLGENSFLKKSIIGPNCCIGANVKIVNSCILSDVTVQDNCTINDSIIFANCVIEKGKKLEACILLPNVKCSNDYNNVYMQLSSDGKVAVEKLEKLAEDPENPCHILLEEDLDAEYDDASSTMSDSSDWSSPSSRQSLPQAEFQDDNELFLSEVIDSLLRGFQDTLKCENLILEINSSRYAYNVSIRQVSYNVIKAILHLPLHHLKTETVSSDEISPTEYFKTLKKILEYFQPIIANYIKTNDAQDDCLHALQDVALTNEDLIKPYVVHLIKYLYDRDILSEEKIIEWYEKDCIVNEAPEHFSDTDEVTQEEKERIAGVIKKEMTPFINWLKEAEESSGSE